MSRTTKKSCDAKLPQNRSYHYGKGGYKHQDHWSEKEYKVMLNRIERRRENSRLKHEQEDYTGIIFRPTRHHTENYDWIIW
jgi:hypothetical protein